MSLLWADFPSGSQGIYGDDESILLDGIYAEVGSSITLVADPDPNVASGRVLRFEGPGGGGTRSIRYVLPGSNDTVGIGCRIWLTNIPTADDRRPAIHVYRDGSNNILATVLVSPTGLIQVYKGSRTSGTLLGATSVPVLTANAWRHVESRIKFDAAAGTVEVRVEGVTVLTLTSQNTGATACAQISLDCQSDGNGGSTIYYAKDLILGDDNGTENNDFIGTCGVYWRPVAADVSSGWARSSGSTDYGLLDESPPVDTDYISADVSLPAPSIMGFDALPADIISIRGIISVVRANKTDGGDGNLQVSLSPNGTDWDDGADNPVSTAKTYYRDVSEVSPTTTDPWTPVEFDTLTIKLNRTV